MLQYKEVIGSLTQTDAVLVITENNDVSMYIPDVSDKDTLPDNAYLVSVLTYMIRNRPDLVEIASKEFSDKLMEHMNSSSGNEE